MCVNGCSEGSAEEIEQFPLMSIRDFITLFGYFLKISWNVITIQRGGVAKRDAV